MKKTPGIVVLALALAALGAFLTWRGESPTNTAGPAGHPAASAMPDVQGAVQPELELPNGSRLSLEDSQAASGAEGQQPSEPRGEPWVRLQYDKHVHGRRLGDVLFEFYGPDWPWLEPLFAGHRIDPDETITINEELGDLEACLPRLPEFLIKNFDETPFGRNPHLRTLPGVMSKDPVLALEQIAREKRYNPSRRELDKQSAEFDALRLAIKSELKNLDDWNKALEVRKRAAILADLEGLDAYRRPKVGWIRIGPILCIGDPAYGSDPRYRTYVSPMGANVAHPECWLFACNYMIDWKLVPEIAAETRSIIEYQESLEPVFIELVAAVPTKP
jgi:hypothetical protein